MAREIMVRKASGELQIFSEEKLMRSLTNAGASPELADDIVDHISRQVTEGTTTKAIHQRAFAMLKAKSKSQAARYNLKRALAMLGPSGFPFERYIGRIFEELGYRTEVGVILKGKCVSHEVDVVLEKDGRRGYIECKFHAMPGMKCNVKVPLYVHSRFEDILARENVSIAERERWVVTNTRFTNDAHTYGTCVGMQMLGWNTGPLGESLERLIDKRKLHPITCLTTLTAQQKIDLLAANIVLCQDISKAKHLVSVKALKEAEELCGHAL